ncbi:hypothetical protein PGT21_017799 [Puccinia graminis f. sp. tritici]|uniref:Uncharacterized protein n=1 Tax=Puccinia graminis f. sp. tritici TaxID=56615 RepID=A0A5B0RGY1_PUCGR|nr:hypothetical protein PGT21_017799 [Puccinia graminis f. sp. tritici]KAA1124659.1 hypothetical protein PGTUg99_027115 [Puccinia graminis f. sp. tritici]
MFDSLKLEKGNRVIHQSHKNHITTLSLENFMRMAHNNDILDVYPKPKEDSAGHQVPDCEDTLHLGLRKLQDEISGQHPNLNWFKLHFMWEAGPGESNASLVQEHPTTVDAESFNNDDRPSSPFEI